ncbi:MAG: peptide-methionine (S)-S-oxide reductase MsrA [Peptostreptococcaceae bacterium]|nr:peptide-methionine (S)-S-oxide reductase MsrA [Peptostreptococcaceae bacterium]
MKYVIVLVIAAVLSLVLFGYMNKNKGDNQEVTEEKNRARTETTKDIYLAGGCFWGVEEYMDRVPGVIDATSGYANGITENPTYEEVCTGDTKHAETVHVMYDTDVISLEEVLQYFYKVVNPVSYNKQGNDEGSQYRTGIFYINEEDLEIIEKSISELQKEYDKEIAIEIKELDGYYLAEEYHQDYLKKNPNGYCHIDLGLADEPLKKIKDDVVIDESKYILPSKEEIKAMLTDEQYKIAMAGSTECAFDNEYYENHEDGIYVDIVTGVPIFSSNDKYESGTGWPSFTKPIAENVIKSLNDNSNNMMRTEVRSNLGNIHLGHVFEDGPKDEGGLRYCMNSSSLKFIPINEMEEKGYGYLLE